MQTSHRARNQIAGGQTSGWSVKSTGQAGMQAWNHRPCNVKNFVHVSMQRSKALLLLLSWKLTCGTASQTPQLPCSPAQAIHEWRSSWTQEPHPAAIPCARPPETHSWQAEAGAGRTQAPARAHSRAASTHWRCACPQCAIAQKLLLGQHDHRAATASDVHECRQLAAAFTALTLGQHVRCTMR